MAHARSVHEAGPASDPFQVLTAEHALLRLQLSRTLEAARRDPGGPEARKALALLREGFGLHERREDQVMYPACERLFGGTHGAAAVLRDEHGAIHRAFDKVLAPAVRLGPVAAPGLNELCCLVDAHFTREEKVLFPFMAAHLQQRDAADLARRLRAVGPG